MVPFGDFLNHQNPPMTQWLWGIKDPNWSLQGIVQKEDYASGYFLHATEPIVKGEQIFGSYGYKANEELLRAYGFVIPDNSEKQPI